jgi:hypothetical protein
MTTLLKDLRTYQTRPPNGETINTIEAIFRAHYIPRHGILIINAFCTPTSIHNSGPFRRLVIDLATTGAVGRPKAYATAVAVEYSDLFYADAGAWADRKLPTNTPKEQ